MAAKILGQSAPSANSLTDLYTVPSAKSAVVSSLAVCNRGAAQATFRVSAAAAGAADAASQYLYYDVVVPANQTWIATIGITLATTDVLRVLGSTGYVTFTAFGDES